MRKLKLQVQISIDGYITRLNGEMDWMVWDWDDELKNYVNELTDSIDTILLGRKMADDFITHWSNVSNDPNDPDYEAGKKFIDIPKVVFTKTLKKSAWQNTGIATGDLTDEIKKLKSQKGKDMIVYGGASFVSALVKEGLIDAYHLFVNPAILGYGMTIYNDVNTIRNMTLVNSISFDCGIVLLHYEPNQ